MRPVYDSHVKKLLDVATSQGCVIEQTKNSHIKVLFPNGKIVVLSGTPSDWRATKNFEADLKRNGIVLNQAPQKKESVDHNKELLHLFEKENSELLSKITDLVEEKEYLTSIIESLASKLGDDSALNQQLLEYRQRRKK